MLNIEFQQIRDELNVPREFPPEVLAAAEAASKRSVRDARFANLLDVPFVTIDPPGSRDLDQAFFALRANGGYTVRYAIDDIGFFVEPGGAIEQEAWRSGQTPYSPCSPTPLYPPPLIAAAACLFPA